MKTKMKKKKKRKKTSLFLKREPKQRKTINNKRKGMGGKRLLCF